MTPDEREDIRRMIDSQGIHQALTGCGFLLISDDRFHDLLRNYRKASKEILEYIGYDE